MTFHLIGLSRSLIQRSASAGILVSLSRLRVHHAWFGGEPKLGKTLLPLFALAFIIWYPRHHKYLVHRTQTLTALSYVQ